RPSSSSPAGDGFLRGAGGASPGRAWSRRARPGHWPGGSAPHGARPGHEVNERVDQNASGPTKPPDRETTVGRGPDGPAGLAWPGVRAVRHAVPPPYAPSDALAPVEPTGFITGFCRREHVRRSIEWSLPRSAPGVECELVRYDNLAE